MSKILIVGLDAAPPKLLYKDLTDDLKNLASLVLDGSRYILRSCHPPITIPAWTVMVTGKSPGELGLYGFRHRRPGDITESYIAHSKLIRYPTIWDTLGLMGKRSIVVGVPPTYPPKPINGYLISCFITPSAKSNYTWPISLKYDLESRFGKYIFDIVYRSEEKDRIISELWKMTKQHFKVLKYLINKKWDFFMFVEIGVDRVQHAFWKYFDKAHHKYEPGNKYEDVIPSYYKLIDHELGDLLKNLPRDTVIIIVSDHGAKAMKGAFCINQWLINMGYLKLRKDVKECGTDLTKELIDWTKTVAWAWGGYYARVFVNLKGREPYGIVDAEEYDNLIEQLKGEISKIRGPSGEYWKSYAYRPNELYPVVYGDSPDLIVYLDNLSWRAAGTLGWKTEYLSENDRGPDDAVHDWNGICTLYDPEGRFTKGDRGLIDIKQIRDIVLSII